MRELAITEKAIYNEKKEDKSIKGRRTRKEDEKYLLGFYLVRLHQTLFLSVVFFCTQFAIEILST